MLCDGATERQAMQQKFCIPHNFYPCKEAIKELWKYMQELQQKDHHAILLALDANQTKNPATQRMEYTIILLIGYV
jgi:hypothetical protein